MTPEQLDEIEKLAEAATPGPWATEVDEFHADSGAHQVALHDCFTEQDADKNAAFIRAMREHALPLVKALREALARCDTLRGLADEKAYESGLYARRMGEAQESLRMMRAAAANFEKAWRESVEAHAETQAEVERLRDIVAVNDQRLADVWDTAKRVLKGEG